MSAGNGNKVQTPVPMVPPGFPAATSSDDHVSYANLLHWSVPLNPNLSSSTFSTSSNISLTTGTLRSSASSSMESMREMIFRRAALQPINLDPESVKTLKRKNVRISTDPQSVAARHRRERISKRLRILQSIVPGGTKMDTASMLDEAIHYVKFLKSQVQSLEKVMRLHGYGGQGLGFSGPVSWVYHHNIVSA